MTEPNTQEAPQVEVTVPIEDLDTFVRVLTQWHGNKVATLRHMQEIPDDATVTVAEVTHQLSGDFRAGFNLGLSMALGELGELPFTAEMEDDAFAIPDAPGQPS